MEDERSQETVPSNAKDRRSIALDMVEGSYSQFEPNIEAIRDLALHAEAHTKSLDDTDEHFVRLVRKWNIDDSDNAIIALRDKIYASAEEVRAALESQPAQSENPDKNVIRAMWSATNEVIRDHVPDTLGRYNYERAFARVMFRRNRDTVMHSSLLIAAAASFEVLFGNLVRAHMTAHPEILKSSELNISTEFLYNFATIEDFWDTQREKRVEKLMRGDVASWLSWYGKHLHVTPQAISPDYPQLLEIFLTRNIHVHNAGQVNEIYISLATRSGVTPRATLKAELPVERPYLLQAIDVLHFTAAVMTYGMLRSLASDFTDDILFADAWEHEVIYELLVDERYDAILTLAPLLRDIAGYRSHVTQVNVWIAIKEVHGLNAIERDVRQWEVRDLDPTYELAKHSLLENYPEASAIADHLFSTGKLSRSHWNGWPVLKGLRAWRDENPESRVSESEYSESEKNY
ncbi:hypothetical protein NLX62_04470 [Mycobacteriaceae bacterium Msp059]|nr:hypothetical protein [Mycobacteriaceae bacterium Msp059]